MRKNNRTIWTVIVLLTAVFSNPLWALVPPDDSKGVRQKIYKHPNLTIPVILQQTNQLPPQASAVAQQQLAGLGLTPAQGRIDARGGRWGTLLFKQPLIPGSGVGNNPKWSNGSPANDTAYRLAAWDAFFDFLKLHQPQLNIDPNEMARPGRVTVHNGGDLVQIYAPRLIDGIPVRDNYVNGVVNHGNLILFGTNTWGDINISTQPRLSKADAVKALEVSLAPFDIENFWGTDELNIITLAKGKGIKQIKLGDGYDYRLAWVIKPLFKDDAGRWAALVDAESGEILSFEDTNHYTDVKGGVLPVSNDGIAPDGVEQPGWPMPFAYVTTTGGTVTTDTGGNLSDTGSMTSFLTGPFVRMNDICGSISLTQSGDLDFGTSGGTDCTTPGFGGAGNTHASRSGFYELNKIKEMARGQLPSNTWLQAQLVANMNKTDGLCPGNAWWNGTVNFCRSSGSNSNTGEIAGVFDHEWGHGLDDNDANPNIANPSGEGIADIYSALRLNDSCIGRNFNATVCAGFGDPCLTCSGVRDIDYLKRASGNPHDYTWSNANCEGRVHCIGSVYSEAVWSLWKRGLQSAPYNMDNNTAHEVVTRLTYIGAGATGTWFSGDPPNGGCDSTSGYMNYLAADDDNGDLSDGTPHMTAIYNAFNAQEIACNTPTVQDSGCAGTPTTAPSVTATAGDTEIDLSWGAVTGASGYGIFRTEGVFGCDFGKVKLGETAGTTWNDSGLQNGRDYSYVVIPIGVADSCMGPASPCVSVGPVSGPDLNIHSDMLSLSGGDGDMLLDNCENGRFTFDVKNTGLGALTNVRISSVTPSYPGVSVIDTDFPFAISPSTLAEGATGTGEFSFFAGTNSLSSGDTLTFQVEVIADEMASSKLTEFKVYPTETDGTLLASKMWDFETDLDGWQVIQGTFNYTLGSGANSSAGYVASSANIAEQCDQFRSPLMQLTDTSELTVETKFEIESSLKYDRANMAVVENGNRTILIPDGGSSYSVNGFGGDTLCDTVNNKPGWAHSQLNWTESIFSSAALGAAGLEGKTFQLDVAYGTDFSITLSGFLIDRVIVTNAIFDPSVDAQSNSCIICTNHDECNDGLFCNGLETCNVVTSSCQAGIPPSCDDGVNCTVDSCNEGTDSCGNVTDDSYCDNGLFCDGAEICDSASGCQDQSDPCLIGECSEDYDSCHGSECNYDLVCDLGEDCSTCSVDCPSFPIPGASCGDGVCDAGNDENCQTCSDDCNSKTNGNPSRQFCCGLDTDCADNRCVADGFQCTDVTNQGGATCCGNSICESPENVTSCGVDCNLPSCVPITEICDDGLDNDCDESVDCDDDDCGVDPVCNLCTLGQKGDSCSVNSECCSNQCKRNGTCR